VRNAATKRTAAGLHNDTVQKDAMRQDCEAQVCLSRKDARPQDCKASNAASLTQHHNIIINWLSCCSTPTTHHSENPVFFAASQLSTATYNRLTMVLAKQTPQAAAALYLQCVLAAAPGQPPKPHPYKHTCWTYMGKANAGLIGQKAPANDKTQNDKPI
jgi:hypothetical protein